MSTEAESTSLSNALIADGSSANAAVFSFTQIDVPGATPSAPSLTTYTQALSINDAGQIVGNYSGGRINHGFLDTASTFTTIDVPGAFYTSAQGINDVGQIVGEFSDSVGLYGFLDIAGTFTTIDVPGAFYTSAQASTTRVRSSANFLTVRVTAAFSTPPAPSLQSTFQAQAIVRPPMASTTRVRSLDFFLIARVATAS